MEPAATNSLQHTSECLHRWLLLKREIEESNTRHGTSFNPLNLIPVSETTHSRILGDLLNPKGSHGQGSLFLNVFLDHLDVPNPEEGEWQTSVEEGRVDVMLWRQEPPSVILIENKAKGAVDQLNQIYRYWHEQVYSWKPTLEYGQDEVQKSFRLIYMPADGSRRPEEQSLRRPDNLKDFNPHAEVPIQYERIPFSDLADLLQRKALRHIPDTNQRVSAFLNFYIEHWKS